MNKKNIFFTGIFSLVTFWSSVCNADTPFWKGDYLKIMKDKVGESYKGSVEDLEAIREDKRPGDQYIHQCGMIITGKATAKTSLLKNLWKTKTSVHFMHDSQLLLRETITSNEDELNNGIISSKFEVMKFSENLVSAKGEFKINSISSKNIFNFFREIHKAHGATVDTSGDALIASGILLLKTGHFMSGILTAGGGIGFKFVKSVADKIPKDGMISLSKKEMETISKDYESFATFIRDLEDSVVETKWEYGKGYTKIFIRSRAKDEYKELLTALIYRSNPVAASNWYPAKLGEAKVVDASKIGGMIFTGAVECDEIKGQLMVRNQGFLKNPSIESMKIFAKEKGIQKIDWDKMVTELGIVNNGSNIIRVIAKANKGNVSSVSASFIPTGKIKIFTPSGKAKNKLPRFVHSVDIEGKVDAKINNKKSWLKDMDIDERDAKVIVSYHQIYLGNK